MIARKKALVVPITVLALWILPGASPGVVVAGTVEVAQQVAVEPEPALRDKTAVAPIPVAPTAAAPIAVAPTAVSPTVVEPLADASAATTVSQTSATVDVAPTTGVATPTEPVALATTTSTTTTIVRTLSALSATTVPAPDPTVPIGEQALDLVAFDWRAQFPTWRVEFRGSRDGIRALTYPAERRIEIFVRSSDTAATLHRVFAHELGHVIDVELNSDQDRARWLEARGIDRDAPWWPSATSPDFHTGAGDFAEAFAVWETGISSRSTIGTQPDAADLELLEELANG